MRILIPFIGLVLPVLVSFAAATGQLQQSVERQSTPYAMDSQVPLHEQIVAWLRRSEAVLPVLPPVHESLTAWNREAVIPPQCYTRTEGRHNPCYVCHQDGQPGRENQMNDGALQRAYSFSEVGLSNHWKNLFEDRSERVAQISDAEILAWVNTDNYSELAPRLRAAGFKGWVPDLAGLERGAAAFDDEGFALDGSGWVAFNYKPMPSTFWPTNGSTGDVMIRLAAPLRSTGDGRPSRHVYRANLALLEASIKDLAMVRSQPIDEAEVGADLDGDGQRGMASTVRRLDHWVGAAKDWFRDSELYPLDTEFLHTVRYLGVDEAGRISNSRRLKEVRYMRKRYVLPKYALRNEYLEEGYAKDAGYLPGYLWAGADGLDNEMGWQISGFIEDRAGRLRGSTYEENLFCMGCHTSIGSTIDKVFSFARKLDGPDGWGYIDLRGMPDAPNRGEVRGEILTYLERVGGGGEFRSNPEMQARWFGADGSVDAGKVAAADVYTLITPSRARALALNKAYRVIVEDQDFIHGRDATVTPPENVYREVDIATAPTLAEPHVYRWDLRLDWNTGERIAATTNVLSH